MRRPADPEVDKSAFQIDAQAKTATCPSGQTVPASKVQTNQAGRAALQFTFQRSICQACPLFERCVHSETAGRTVSTGFYEEYLIEARQRQEADEFKTLYRLRPRIEGKQAELAAHGLRDTRCIGAAKQPAST